MSRCRTFRYRVHPTANQVRALAQQLDYQRELYNAAMEERIGAWQWERRSVTYFDQCTTLTGLIEAKAGLNRSNLDAGWATLLSHLIYKAECAGRTIVTVKPHYTSLTCYECGHVEPGNRLSQAEFRCCKCGQDHADTNAARNILRAGS
jgi:transposase